MQREGCFVNENSILQHYIMLMISGETVLLTMFDRVSILQLDMWKFEPNVVISIYRLAWNSIAV